MDEHARVNQVVWRVQRGGSIIERELRTALDFLDTPSCEMVVSGNGITVYTRLFPTADIAAQNAERDLRALLETGWAKVEL